MIDGFEKFYVRAHARVRQIKKWLYGMRVCLVFPEFLPIINGLNAFSPLCLSWATYGFGFRSAYHGDDVLWHEEPSPIPDRIIEKYGRLWSLPVSGR